MQNVEVDKQKGTAKAQGGCLLSEVDKATQEHGLAVSAGIISQPILSSIGIRGPYIAISVSESGTTTILLIAPMNCDQIGGVS